MKHAGLGDRGAEALSHALAVNRVVKQLSLQDNELTGQGVFHILRGMLTRMDVAGGMLALMDPEEESEGVVRCLCCFQG
jgi:Leucine Rich repeat